VKINYDLESTPLELKTDSELGSGEKVFVEFYTAGDDVAGEVILTFSSKVEYFLSWCSYRSPLPTQPPSTTDKVWRITLSRTSGTRVMIHCNDVEVLNVILSRTTCPGSSGWKTIWTHDVEKINFDSRDTASDHYRPGNYNVLVLGQSL
jgi:hypothetical protein